MLWRYYLGVPFRVGESICAPYRVDKNPSMSFYYDSTKHKICAKDHGRGTFHGDVFDYVRIIYGLDFYSTLVKINLDFNLGLMYNSSRYLGVVRKATPNLAELREFENKHDNLAYSGITYSQRELNLDDKRYWYKYGISAATLFLYKVHAVKDLKINGQSSYRYTAGLSSDNPCYIYYFPATRYRAQAKAKCYWPKAPEGSIRFLGNASNKYDVQGYDQCSIATKKEGEKGEFLVLTKSMKDCMLFHELGIEAMAPHGESQLFTNEFIAHLKRYYKVIVSLYDKDITGVRGAKKLWKDHQIRPYFIPKKYNSKDLTDMYKKEGRKETIKLIKNIKKDNNA